MVEANAEYLISCAVLIATMLVGFGIIHHKLGAALDREGQAIDKFRRDLRK